MRALILHNVTTVADLAADGDTESAALIARGQSAAKGLAIFRRITSGDNAPIEPGDRLRAVGVLDFPKSTAVEGVCNAAYAAGNSPYDDPGVTEYRSWEVRSLSVGDVVLTEGRAFAVAPSGWQEIDATLAAYKVESPHRLTVEWAGQ